MNHFEIKTSPNCHPVVSEAWKAMNENFSVLKNADPEITMELIRNRIHSEICDRILKNQASKVLSSIYTNSAGVKSLVIGYDIKHPDTWHIIVKLNKQQN